jgi:hypothetical protein
VLLAVVALAGCGEKDEPSSAPPKARQSQAAGGGDEEPIRQRMAITVGRSSIKPTRVQVNAFLGIRLIVRNATKRKQVVRVRGARPARALQLGAGLKKNLDLEGLRPGSYRIVAEPAGSGLLVVRRATP